MSGTILSLDLRYPKYSKKPSIVRFKDIRKFFGADKQMGLKALCNELKLPMRKDDCTLDEMRAAGHFLQKFDDKVDFINPAMDPNFEKVYNYCLQDCRCVFGLMEYIGNIFCTIEKTAQFFEHPKCPAKYAYLFYFLTNAQGAYKLLPHSSSVSYQTLSDTFLSLTDVSIANIIRRSIYGGKTLAPAIGLIIKPPEGCNIGCWDISSM